MFREGLNEKRRGGVESGLPDEVVEFSARTPRHLLRLCGDDETSLSDIDFRQYRCVVRMHSATSSFP